jgi:hypothetical protein
LAGVEGVGRYHPQGVAPIRYDHSEQSARAGFAVIHEAKLPLNALLIDGNRIVEERLFGLLPLDPVRPNLTEVIPVS